MKKIEIVVPVYNEEKMIDAFLERLTKVIDGIKEYVFEIQFINDGSSDRTLELIKKHQQKDPRISFISLSRNFGKEIAMIAGIDYCNADAAIFIDADLQDPPEIIPMMIEYWEDGFEDVYAKRKSRKGDSLFKRVTAKMYYRVLQSVASVEIQKDTGDFRLLDKKCIDALKKIRETCRNSKGIFSWIGFKKKAILFDREARTFGESKWNFKKLMKLAIDGITSFTTSPLKISTFIGSIIMMVFMVYLVYIIISASVFSKEEFLLKIVILLLLLFSGIQVIMLGIIGEYLGRIFNETKQRPLYFVSEEGSKHD